VKKLQSNKVKDEKEQLPGCINIYEFVTRCELTPKVALATRSHPANLPGRAVARVVLL